MFRKLSVRIMTGLAFVIALVTLPAFAAGQNQPVLQNETPPPAYDPAVHVAEFVEVKFIESSGVRLREGQLTDFDQGALSRSADQQTVDLPNLLIEGQWGRMFTSSEAELADLRINPQTRAVDPSLPDLNLYYRLFLTDGVSPADAIKALTPLEIVEAVYAVPKPGPLPVPPDYNDINDGNLDTTFGNMYQKYADAAPEGIDARYAWSGFHGTGDGVKVCDLEGGYYNHADLPGVTQLGPSINTALPSASKNHGTAVLGIVGAKDNNWGIKGLAYDSKLYFATTQRSFFGIPFTDNADAIIKCTNALGAGDVIIIEAQIQGPGPELCDDTQEGCVPVEYHKGTYDVIKLAVAKGITVIEAAGNGNNDLDQSKYNPGHDPFDTSKDSGAIMVGASNSGYRTTERERADFSNHGNTVDLFAWGMDIIAPGYGDYYNNEGFLLDYTLFGGTSGASPIVASAAAIVQSNYKAKNGSYATPAQVKQLLQDNSTSQLSEDGENIGVMPDLRGAIDEIWGIGTVVPPVITPASGLHQMPLQATIEFGDASQNNGNTHLRYTLNGTEPTEDSFVYLPGDTLYLNYGVTVRAKAFSNFGGSGYVGESETITAIYLSSTPKVATPVISPNGGTYNQGTQLILTTSTAGAEIRYRLDGRTPSFFYPGTVYSGPVNLPVGTHNVAARAYKDGFYKSDVAYSGQIVINAIQLPNPVIYPNGGQFAQDVTVYLGSTVLGGNIHYTLDGSTPTTSSPKFTEPIVLTEDTTVKAGVFLTPYAPSGVISVDFEVTAPADPPVITPVSGTTAVNSLQVSISSGIPGATIRYTTNGAEPTSYSSSYNGPFILGHGQTTVKAKAFLQGSSSGSSTATAVYTVYDPADLIDPPKIFPLTGNYNGPITVTVTTETDVDALTVGYTTDGSEPYSTPATTVFSYNGPFTLPASATDYRVKARAFKDGAPVELVDSTTSRFTIVTPTLGQVVTPTISPPAGTYTNTFTAKVTATDFLAPFRIRGLHITQDGTMPVANRDNQQSGAAPVNVSVSESKTIQAIASQVGWEDSPMATADYKLQCDLPAIMGEGTYTTTAEISMSTGTSIGKIYYTTDGSDPDEGDTEYSTPFNLGVGEHVVKAMCTRTNFEPSEIAIAALIVNPTPVLPVMTQQPSNQSGVLCGAAEFNAMATGTPDPTYQWLKNGDVIGGENEPTFELPILRLTDAGAYSVEVSNAAGDVTSNAVTLTVSDTGGTCFDPKQAQTITFAPLPDVTLGMTTTLSASASSGLTVTYQSETPTTCSVSENIATTLAIGTCTVIAGQAGDDTYETAESVSQSFEVLKKPQVISFPKPPAASDDLEVGSMFNVAATAESGDDVTYSSETPAVCSINGVTAIILTEGTCTIVATVAASDEFETTTVKRNFVIGTRSIYLPLVVR